MSAEHAKHPEFCAMVMFLEPGSAFAGDAAGWQLHDEAAKAKMEHTSQTSTTTKMVLR